MSNQVEDVIIVSTIGDRMGMFVGMMRITADGKHQFFCDELGFREISPDNSRWRGEKPKDWKPMENWNDIIFDKPIDLG